MRVVLVDDHVSYRQSFRIALTKLTDVQVVGEAGSSREAIHLIERTRPDLAIVDFFLTDSDGVSLTRELRRRRNRTPVLMLTQLSHPLFVRERWRRGSRDMGSKQKA
jgi:DNA-binding NarL/FixJ family response regulator